MKITIDKDVLDQALEALRYCRATVASVETERRQAIAALRDALAQPQQEPVFWYRPRSDGRYEGPIHNAMIEKVRRESGGWMPLYTSPPAQRQPLTAGDRDKVFDRADKRMQSNTNTAWRNAIVDEVEAAHGINV